MNTSFYFDKFEDRKPYPAIPDSELRTRFFHFFGIATTLFGLRYLHWRWFHSLNTDALWFSLPLVLAETLSFIGSVLMIINFWSNKDAAKTPPVRVLSEIEDLQGRQDRPVEIDVFIATYDEEVELVRKSIRDAKAMTYPYTENSIRIFVLDDGDRDGRNPAKENMKQVAIEEGVYYLTRENHRGYKAGNLKHALEHTHGDLFVILDADTRPFPGFLEHTTGYFRRHKMAWVQTPQWFFDTTPAEPLNEVLTTTFNIKNRGLNKLLKTLFGKITINEDIFGNDPRLFYDVILRKRNFYNAAFCCGAGSIHRREALMSLAVRDFAANVQLDAKRQKKNGDHPRQLIQHELIPFKYHASEDIYTSLMLHADRMNRWESLQHPDIECKMLSTQDLNSWVKQHRRYAEGTLDIAFHDNPLFMRGLTWGQRVCYFNTVWSYFAPLWIVVFLLSPIVSFFTFELPVKGYDFEFMKYFFAFQAMNAMTFALGCWGISTKRGDQYYISGFWFMLLSLWSIATGKQVKFEVTAKNSSASAFRKNLKHIAPHLILITASLAGIAFNGYIWLFGYHPTPSGFVSNAFWTVFNLINLSIMLRAAAYTPPMQSEQGDQA